MSKSGMMRYLQEQGGATVQELSEEFNIGKRSIRSKANSLSKVGLVNKNKSVDPMIILITKKGSNYDVSKLEGMVV